MSLKLIVGNTETHIATEKMNETETSRDNEVYQFNLSCHGFNYLL